MDLELPLDALGERADNIANRADQGTDRNTNCKDDESKHVETPYRFRSHQSKSTSWIFMTLRLSDHDSQPALSPSRRRQKMKPGVAEVGWSPSVGCDRPVSVSCMLLYTKRSKKFQTIFRLARKCWCSNERFFWAGFNSCANWAFLRRGDRCAGRAGPGTQAPAAGGEDPLTPAYARIVPIRGFLFGGRLPLNRWLGGSRRPGPRGG